MMAKAVRRGMATGLVVTCYLPHATPGAFYAHQVYRRTLEPIAEQLVESGVDVAFGGGKRYFTARRADGTTLVDRLRTKGYRVIDTLAAADTIASGKVVGLFASKHMPYAHKGRGDYLPRAVGKALEILSNDAAERDEGFMLVVEGSMIDCRTVTTRREFSRRCAISTGRCAWPWSTSMRIRGRCSSLRPTTKRAV